jgi:hypothetical protein
MTSKKANALWEKYQPFVGKKVTITAPRYLSLSRTDDLVAITGKVIGLAWRETGIMTGTAYDLVLLPAVGAMRTIALSRIVECREIGRGDA